MAQGKVSGAAAEAGALSSSPSTATMWLVAAAVAALGFLVFSEMYSWVVPIVLALIGGAGAAALATGRHQVALAISCVFVVAVVLPMIGALAFIVGPFLNSIQSGEVTFLGFIQTVIDVLAAGALAIFCATKALRSFPAEIVEKYFSYGIVSTPRFIIGTLILVGIAVNFGNVLGRYLFLAPIIWAEEIMIYIMVWMVFVGSVLVTWDGHHLKMDFFSIMLPSTAKEIMNFTGVVAFVLACLFVLPQTHLVTNMMYDLDQRSVVAEIPMVIPHFALLLGFSIMFVAVVYRFRRLVTGDLASEVDELVASTEAQDAESSSAPPLS